MVASRIRRGLATKRKRQRVGQRVRLSGRSTHEYRAAASHFVPHVVGYTSSNRYVGRSTAWRPLPQDVSPLHHLGRPGAPTRLRAPSPKARGGGGKEIRTPGLLNAIQALYQLSYTPILSHGLVQGNAYGRRIGGGVSSPPRRFLSLAPAGYPGRGRPKRELLGVLRLAPRGEQPLGGGLAAVDEVHQRLRTVGAGDEAGPGLPGGDGEHVG